MKILKSCSGFSDFNQFYTLQKKLINQISKCTKFEKTNEHWNFFWQQVFNGKIFKKLKIWDLIEQPFNEHPGRGQKVCYYLRKKAYYWPKLKAITVSSLKFDILLEINYLVLHPENDVAIATKAFYLKFSKIQILTNLTKITK